MESSDLAAAVLTHVNRSDYRPVKPRVIAKQLGIDEDSFRSLQKTIKSLVKQGKLSFGASHLVVPATANQAEGRPRDKADTHRHGAGGRVVGVFRRTSGGHGFVRPSGVT